MYTLYSFFDIITSMKFVVVLLSDGFEEIESVTPVDLLRRAGFKVCLISMNETLEVVGSRGIKILADMSYNDLDFSMLPDAVFCPGGLKGSINLSNHSTVKKLLIECNNANKIISAICAAPIIVLSPLGFLDGKKFTCFPDMLNSEYQSKNADVSGYQDSPVVQDGNLITSQGAGTASNVAFKLIEVLESKELSEKIKGDTIF